MKAQPDLSLANISLTPVPPRLLLIVIQEPDHKAITDLIARLALGGAFHLISNGHWLPDQDAMLEAVRRYTVAVEEALNNPIIGRPANCFRLRDQLARAVSQPYAILILNFLHDFFDPDLELPLRQQVLRQCCQSLKDLSRSKPVVVIVRQVDTQEYQQFFRSLASVADDVLEAEEAFVPEAIQCSLL